ncbi:MAG: PAS domain S-box protein, partial [Rhodothermales bacterium]
SVDVIEDITERKQAVEALRESEARLAHAQRMAHLGSWEWDIQRDIQHWSDETYRVFGLDPGETEASFESLMARVHPDDVARVNEATKTVAAESPPPPFEYRIIRPDGEVRTILAEAVLSLDDAGQPAVMAGTMLDITERKQAEEALRESEARVRTILETAVDAIITIDEKGSVETFNTAAERIFGYSEEEIVDRNIKMLMPSPIREEHDHYIRTHLDTGKRNILGASREASGVRKDGSVFPIEISVNEVDFGRRKIFTGIVRDITERKRAEEALQHYADDLKRSNQELEQFAYIASHDLQEPLRKIQAFGDRIQDKYLHLLDERPQDYFQRMQSAAARMQTLITDLLALSRVTSKAQPFVAVDLGEVVSEVLSDLEVQIEQTGGRVEVGALPVVEADRVQMRQLFQNLIGNALKFHREGVAPRVRIGGEVSCNGEASLRQCVLSVRDNGIGFERKYVDRIFRPFQRLHGRSRYEGTGIGLAICEKIVQRHGGGITVESEPGEGTTFFIALNIEHVGTSGNHSLVEGA